MLDRIAKMISCIVAGSHCDDGNGGNDDETQEKTGACIITNLTNEESVPTCYGNSTESYCKLISGPALCQINEDIECSWEIHLDKSCPEVGFPFERCDDDHWFTTEEAAEIPLEDCGLDEI